jgi:hypothetical protein
MLPGAFAHGTPLQGPMMAEIGASQLKKQRVVLLPGSLTPYLEMKRVPDFFFFFSSPSLRAPPLLTTGHAAGIRGSEEQVAALSGQAKLCSATPYHVPCSPPSIPH